ncbi:MAG TPA: FlgD immunoglobulin-like domain containing protein [Candidatus Eisenbacteria bacterium]|nr:FlgD immunoglobulin-like domain containing protein [Candidatus Eisenbacteria bacterium]
MAALILGTALAPRTAGAQGAGQDSIVLVWTAPGDDGQVGTAAGYEVRFSTSPINEASWASATLINGPPTPQPAGTRQSMPVRSLTNGTTYWFGIKTVDDVGNWSGISNVIRWDWIFDTAAPAAPLGLAASRQSDGSVRLTWTANGEPDLAGYSIYRRLSATGPFVTLNGSLLTGAQYVDATVPPGTETAWYQLSASDDSGNESARSGILSVSLVAEVTAWTLEPGYPNPSGPGAQVSIPLVVPSGGGAARLEIVNRAGQRVRIVALGALPPGPSLAQWDGRNDSGLDVAPGVYTAWLIAGSTRVSTRLVRTP